MAPFPDCDAAWQLEDRPAGSFGVAVIDGVFHLGQLTYVEIYFSGERLQ